MNERTNERFDLHLLIVLGTNLRTFKTFRSRNNENARTIFMFENQIGKENRRK